MIERLSPMVMSDSETFTTSVQVHLRKRYSKFLNAAWEERQCARQLDRNGASATARAADPCPAPSPIPVDLPGVH